MLQESNQRCHGTRGTFPFVVSEVCSDERYEGCAADVWSLDIVFSEVFCGVKVLECSFKPSMPLQMEQVTEKVRSSFHRAEGRQRMFPGQTLSELHSLASSLEPSITRMLSVDISQRWPAVAVADFLTPMSVSALALNCPRFIPIAISVDIFMRYCFVFTAVLIAIFSCLINEQSRQALVLVCYYASASDPSKMTNVLLGC